MFCVVNLCVMFRKGWLVLMVLLWFCGLELCISIIVWNGFVLVGMVSVLGRLFLVVGIFSGCL